MCLIAHAPVTKYVYNWACTDILFSRSYYIYMHVSRKNPKKTIMVSGEKIMQKKNNKMVMGEKTKKKYVF